MEQQETDCTLSYEEAAQMLGCSPRTLRAWVSQGRVPYTKVGRLTRFRRTDLRAYLARHTVQPRNR